jgi:hypothetical protein
MNGHFSKDIQFANMYLQTLNIINHEGNASPNYNETCHTNHYSYYHKMLMKR